jgi:hypothetical protein
MSPSNRVEKAIRNSIFGQLNKDSRQPKKGRVGTKLYVPSAAQLATIRMEVGLFSEVEDFAIITFAK